MASTIHTQKTADSTITAQTINFTKKNAQSELSGTPATISVTGNIVSTVATVNDHVQANKSYFKLL